MKFPVFDLHCDTALALLNTHSTLRSNDLHIDLERAGKYPGYAQCFACFTSPLEHAVPQQVFALEEAQLREEVACNSDLVAFAGSAEQIENNRASGRASAILTIEGPAGFDYDPARLEHLYADGFCITTLGWNENSPLAGSHATGGGLTALGAEYVRKAQKAGMLIDVSHISDEAFWDIIRCTAAPIVATHSNSRAICQVSRNLSDEMFRAICATGGVVGINLYSDFLGMDPDVDTVCEHILHFMGLDPGGTHIALGGDLDGCSHLPAGIGGIEDYDVLAARLLERGLSIQEVENIFWNNAIGVMTNAVCQH